MDDINAGYERLAELQVSTSLWLIYSFSKSYNGKTHIWYLFTVRIWSLRLTKSLKLACSPLMTLFSLYHYSMSDLNLFTIDAMATHSQFLLKYAIEIIQHRAIL